MSGALSKRQQARNERTLQELIKSVPGNNVCADCQARNPGETCNSLGRLSCVDKYDRMGQLECKLLRIESQTVEMGRVLIVSSWVSSYVCGALPCIGS
jgi:hypothetical protein